MFHLDIVGFHPPLRREQLHRRYSWRLKDSSSLKRVLQAVKQFQLLLRFQHEHLLQQLARSDNIYEAVDVDVDKSGHEELTVESVHDASMAGDNVTKVLDLECPLES